MKHTLLRRAVATLCAGLMASTPALACTDVRLMAKDGSAFSSRTMDFGMDLESALLIVPRGNEVVSPAPKGNGLTWKGKYGYVGMNAFNLSMMADGMNEKGLGFGALYLPGETKYQDVPADGSAKALSNALFGDWVLSNFETVEEVKAALNGVTVWGESMPQFGSFIPLHFTIHDATGKSIVIEYVGGAAKVYDNTVGVLTNSPTYDWHIQNLRNYVYLSPLNAGPEKIGNVTYTGTGQGSGLYGLPGDPTPPSRFIMAVASSHLAIQPANSAEALTQAQHIMNRVDIPRGMVRDYSKTTKGTVAGDYTLWTVFRDHANLVYYWKTYDHPNLRAIDLTKIDFSKGQSIRQWAITTSQPAAEMIDSKDLKPAKLQ
ncbi:Choloylglycine hydrolase [Hyphomicrobium sulfonivorans]|uniref:Choloylglycine hydrolase n=1 Tax=Hyphomicrobium sulfonivorans TaxID=121290 RepID=A0A109BLN5_HYPSL|nr:choloylglycine hydrolase family protein [Hyphomicrobium sulfonivorans]KWT71074.1 Choloylglycine hydrolase [Hyphomicrobium sulfonivorans]